MDPAQDATRRRLRLAALSVLVVFALNGFLFANWFSRLPTVRDLMDLDPSTLGGVLLFGAFGSLLSMPLTGVLVSRIGPRYTVLGGALLGALGLAGAASAAQWGTPITLAAALFVAMMGIGCWDVAMNFAGTRVEQGLRREIMPWFHGGYSLGTVGGAAAGTILTRAQIDISWHIYVATAATWVLVAVFAAGFVREHRALPGPGVQDTRAGGSGATDGPPPKWWAGWTEPRTVLIGVVVLAAALTEGAANDWLALAVVDGFGVSNDVGAFGFTIFVTAMTVMRFCGVLLLSRFSRVFVLRLCVGLAFIGLTAFTLAPSLPVAMAGAVLWGLGAALGFPVGMSAAADDPQRAAVRLSVVSTIGYAAFLCGPPLLGLLADHIGYRHALLAIMVPLVVGFFVTHVAAPPKESTVVAQNRPAPLERR